MRLRAALVIVAAAIAFAPSATAPFISYDDPLYVTNNPRVQSGGLVEIWNPVDALSGKELEFFPLRDSVYSLLWHLFGNNATPFHVVNIAAHAACAVLVGLLARKLVFALARSSTEPHLEPSSRGRDRAREPNSAPSSAPISALNDARADFIALSAALLFAIHPLHVESVSWVAGLKDPMFCGFMLASVIAHIDGKRGVGVAFLVASLSCKSLGIVTPLLLVVIERARGTKWSETVARVAPSAIVAGAATLFFVVVGHANGVVQGPHGGSWATHEALMAWAYARYVQQAIVPTDFALQYCFDATNPVHAVVGAFALIATIALIATVRRRPLAFILVAWFPIALLPVMNIVPFPAIMADRYLYAPSVAVCIGAALLLAKLARFRMIAIGAVVVVLASVTALRASLWRDEASLWRVVLEDDVCAADPTWWVTLGTTLRDHRAALDAFDHAMRMPAIETWSSERRCALHAHAATEALAIGEVARAKREVSSLAGCPPALLDDDARAAVAHATGDVDAELAAAEAAAVSGDPGLVWNRGVARLRAGRVDDGVRDVEAALAAKPEVLCPLAHAVTSSELSEDAKMRVAQVVSRLCR